MPRAANPQKGKAKKLWKKGKNAAEIARELGIPNGTTRRWKSEWEKENERSKQKSAEDTNGPKRIGAPIGNRNAAGNAGGGAPKGNRNAYKHGAYAFPFWDTLTDEEKEKITASIGTGEEERLQGQLVLLDARQRRLMQGIARAKEECNLEHVQIYEAELTKTQRAYSRIVMDLHRVRTERKQEEETAQEVRIVDNIKGGGEND